MPRAFTSAGPRGWRRRRVSAVETVAFTSMADFAADRPFRQTLTVDPATGMPTNFPRYFRLYESGAFIQDQWTVSRNVSVSLGLRHDYFGTVSEREGRLSSIVLGIVT